MQDFWNFGLTKSFQFKIQKICVQSCGAIFLKLKLSKAIELFSLQRGREEISSNALQLEMHVLEC